MRKVLVCLSLLSTFLVSAQKGQIFIAMDVNGCNSCIQIASALASQTEILEKTYFLFNSEVTYEQAESFLSETLQLNGKIKIDDGMFNKFLDLYPTPISRKVPKILLYDEASNEIIKSLSVDSISIYRNFLDSFLNFGKLKYSLLNHDLKGVKKLIGYKSLIIKSNKLVVNTYQNPHRLFVYNFINRSLDSLVIDTNLEKSILFLNNIDTKNFTQELKWHRESGFPHFSSFITNQTLNDSSLNGIIVTRFYNHNSTDSILFPTQIFQFFDYNFQPKRLRLFTFDALWSGDSISDGPIKSDLEYYQEFDYPFIDAKGNWNTFINFQPRDSFSKTKMIAKFTFNKSEKKYTIDTLVSIIKFDTIATFTGDKFYDPSFYFDYKLKNNYFFYHNAPLIRNIESNVTLNILNYVHDANWIDDILTTNQGVFYALINSKRGRILLMFDESSNKLLSAKKMDELDNILFAAPKVSANKNSRDVKNTVSEVSPSAKKVSLLKSNIVLGDDLSIYFINNEGVIKQLKPIQ